MFEYGEDHKGCCCYFHSKEVVVGVCCMCLNERLLILASKQASSTTLSFTQTKSRKKNYKSLSKIFHFTHSFIHRFELIRHRQPPPPPPPPPANNYDTTDDDDDDDDDTSTSSQEDSFISIKFENNGAASWEKSNFSKSWNDSKDATGPTSVVKHAKSRGPSLRWHKRIGHLFQVIRWKRSSKGNVGHVAAKLEGVKVRNGWIRTLTKRRTK